VNAKRLPSAPPRRTHLTRDDILAAALALIDGEGADALTMRRLARDLGIEAMSLYHHFENKQAILDGVIERALQGEAPAGPIPERWQDAVAGAVLGFRRVLVKHPNVLPIMAAHPPTTPESSVYITGPLQFLTASGFAEDVAAELFQAVFAMSFGHAMLSTSYPPLEVDGAPRVEFTEAAFARSLQVLLDGYGAARGEPR
jgi:AcrR family transcriptional regulator